MQVKITAGGEEFLVLTRNERESLRKASVLLASIGRHIQPKEMADAMANAGTSIESFLESTEAK